MRLWPRIRMLEHRKAHMRKQITCRHIRIPLVGNDGGMRFVCRSGSITLPGLTGDRQIRFFRQLLPCAAVCLRASKLARVAHACGYKLVLIPKRAVEKLEGIGPRTVIDCEGRIGSA